MTKPKFRSHRELFPELTNLNTYRTQREHIHQRLAEMAEDGSLYVTECLTLPEPIPTLVREVIHRTDRLGPEGAPRGNRPLDPALKKAEIRLRCIPHRVQHDVYRPELGRAVPEFREQAGPPVTFRLPDLEIDGMGFDEARSRGLAGEDTLWSSAEGRTRNIVEIQSEEFELPIEEAVFCLDKIGKFVRRARSTKSQQTEWKVEEIHPSGEQPSLDAPKRKATKRRVIGEKKRGPGRPKKDG